MESIFADFSEGKKIEDLYFRLPKTLSGHYLLDSVFSKKVNTENRFPLYSFHELKNIGPFVVINKRTSTPSKYKTSEGFINRLKKELYFNKN